MLRMLIVIHNNMEAGGIESYLLNTFARMDLSQYQIDIFVPGKVISRDTSSKLEILGCTIYEQFISGGNIRKAVGLTKKLTDFLKIHQYDVVYVNVGNIVRQAISISISHFYDIHSRIAHSHNAIPSNNFIQGVFFYFLQQIIVRNATHLAACSKAAALYQFGKEAAERAVIIKNGIDTKKFRFCEEIRVHIRQKLQVENNFVIGHVGRFNKQKNHQFLIEIFRSISQQNTSAKLLLVGAGELENTIRDMVDSYGLTENVIFAGVTDRVEDYLCAMDVFVLPSLFEGLGIVNVEAQAVGLPCIVSDVVPKEAAVTDWIEFLPIVHGVDMWVNRVMHYQYNNCDIDRVTAWQTVFESGYDISNTAQTLQELLNNLTQEGT